MLVFALRTMSDLSVGGNNLHLVVFNFSFSFQKKNHKKKLAFGMYAIVISSFIVLGLEVYVKIWITLLLV
jgi:hypothetical protein